MVVVRIVNDEVRIDVQLDYSYTWRRDVIIANLAVTSSILVFSAFIQKVLHMKG
jgi:GH15 family glucan-1,4-alpha-glucosidase